MKYVITELDNLDRQYKLTKEMILTRNKQFNVLVTKLVILQQRYRNEKNYQVSDNIREILNSIGIVIIQGGNGRNPIGDQWTEKEISVGELVL